jgi:cysteine desulfurase/selenocysteine lyase
LTFAGQPYGTDSLAWYDPAPDLECILMRVYLDNAATSWPKPASVYEACDHYMRESGAPAGRGSYREADEVGRRISQCRRQLASLLGSDKPDNMIFTAGGTDSLNLAIKGIVNPTDHVITTVAEHNSVLRPLRQLEENQQVAVTRVSADAGGLVAIDDIAAAIRPNTRLIAILHVSNVTGALQPIDQVVQLGHQHGIVTLLDAAQSLGHLPFSLAEVPVDLLACSAHKGLMGPLGLGLLYVADTVAERLRPLRQGGTGTDSNLDKQPETLPEKFESGNLNVPAILGLEAALQFVLETGVETIHARIAELTAELRDGFAAIENVQLHAPSNPAQQLGVVSINLPGFDPREVAATLDHSFGIQVRAGMHCAPLLHPSLGTDQQGGTIRFSPGWFNTTDEIQNAIAAISELSAASWAEEDSASTDGILE